MRIILFNNKMKYLNKEGRLYDDNCSLLTKEIQNKNINNYNLDNTYFTKDCDCSIYTNLLYDNNLVIKDGYGFSSGCVIDNDSQLRNNSKNTNQRERELLCPRSFQGVPNLNKGGFIPNIDSKLRNSDDTTDIKICDNITEKNFNRFQPPVNCLLNEIQNPDNIIYPWVRGGNDTRFNMKINKCNQK